MFSLRFFFFLSPPQKKNELGRMKELSERNKKTSGGALHTYRWDRKSFLSTVSSLRPTLVIIIINIAVAVAPLHLLNPPGSTLSARCSELVVYLAYSTTAWNSTLERDQANCLSSQRSHQCSACFKEHVGVRKKTHARTHTHTMPTRSKKKMRRYV